MTIFSLQWSVWISNKIKNLYSKMSRFALGFMPHQTETKAIGNTTTSTISALPKELVVEILSRLPPMAFFRCRSICKSWLSHSADAFHLNKHFEPNITGIFHNKNQAHGGSTIGFRSLSCDANMTKFTNTAIGSLPHPDRLEILDCCNGILLVGTMGKKFPFFDNIFAYNPATQTQTYILGCSKFIKKHRLRSCSLAFDTKAPSLFHFINFDTCIRNRLRILQIDLFTFDRDKHKCKHKKFLLPDISMDYLSKSTFMYGRVHHLTLQNKILTIDPIKWSYYMIRLPDCGGHSSVEIGNSQGLLHCVTYHLGKGLSIWILKNYAQQEWTLKYQLSFQQIASASKLCNIHFSYFLYHIHQKRFVFHLQEDKLFVPLGDIGLVSFNLSSV